MRRQFLNTNSVQIKIELIGGDKGRGKDSRRIKCTAFTRAEKGAKGGILSLVTSANVVTYASSLSFVFLPNAVVSKKKYRADLVTMTDDESEGQNAVSLCLHSCSL